MSNGKKNNGPPLMFMSQSLNPKNMLINLLSDTLGLAYQLYAPDEVGTSGGMESQPLSLIFYLVSSSSQQAGFVLFLHILSFRKSGPHGMGSNRVTRWWRLDFEKPMLESYSLLLSTRKKDDITCFHLPRFSFSQLRTQARRRVLFIRPLNLI